MRRFPFDKNYAAALRAAGIDPAEVLRRAGLSQTLLTAADAALTNEEYLRFMQAVAWAARNPETPVALATAEGVESITPAVLAAYCSADGLACLKRLSQFKALAGPVRLHVCETGDTVRLEIAPWDEAYELPEIVVGVEACLMVNLVRRATKEPVAPVSFAVPQPFGNAAYERFLGCETVPGKVAELVFRADDLRIPFVTRNDSLWAFFEPELRRRLAELETDDSAAAQVRCVLVELLPAGRGSMACTARALAMSTRTLQRKLAAEGTTFTAQLNHVRELLAKSYLDDQSLSAMEIALLLGYGDANSFYRAFALWTGQTVSEYRARAQGRALPSSTPGC